MLSIHFYGNFVFPKRFQRIFTFLYTPVHGFETLRRANISLNSLLRTSVSFICSSDWICFQIDPVDVLFKHWQWSWFWSRPCRDHWLRKKVIPSKKCGFCCILCWYFYPIDDFIRPSKFTTFIIILFSPLWQVVPFLLPSPMRTTLPEERKIQRVMYVRQARKK